MSQAGYRQASVRAVTGSAETYEGDWHRLFDQAGIRQEQFNGRMLLWINLMMGRTYINLPEAMQAFAESRGAANFSSLGTFIPAPTGYGFLALDSSVLTLSGNPLLMATS